MHRISTVDHQAEAGLVAGSARRVALGLRPLERMALPALSGANNLVYLDGKKLMHAGYGRVAGPFTENTALLIARSRDGVIYADRGAFRAAMRAMASYKPVTRAISYLSSLPMNGQHAILTDALSQKFVAPGPGGDIATWSQAFYLGGAYRDVILELIKEASGGDSPVFPGFRSDLHSSANALAVHLYAGAARAIDAFKAVTRYVDLWTALLCADPLLRDSYLRSGDTVTVSPLKMLGGLVECRVSTPFKIRPGSEVVVWQDGISGVPATLVSLGFDHETECLTATFTKPTTGKRRRNGYDLLFEATDHGKRRSNETFYVTTRPFTGSPAMKSSTKSPNTWSAGRSVSRELPLFVSLAAAAQSPGGSP